MKDFLWKIATLKRQAGDKTIHVWYQIIVIGVLYAAYEYTSSLASGARATATRNALREVSLEQHLHAFFEQHLQAFVIAHAVEVIKLSDLYYVTLHFILPVVVIVLLLAKYPERYIRWRNTMVLLNVFALVVFITFPVAPPRLLPASFHFINTQSVFGGAGNFDALLMKEAGNQFAAMPSLHFAWALWCTLAIVPVVRNRVLKVLLLLHPILTAFIVFVTANHFWLDVLAGGIDFYLSYLIAGGRRIELWRVREPVGSTRAAHVAT